VRAGRLVEYVDLLRPVKGAVSRSGAPKSAYEYEKTIMASVEPLRGREKIQAAQLEASISHRLRTHYDPDITPRHRLDIFSVVDVFSRHRELEILATEVA
jgi:SPP1 family predicted phage head-tail adaptor